MVDVERNSAAERATLGYKPVVGDYAAITLTRVAVAQFTIQQVIDDLSAI